MILIFRFASSTFQQTTSILSIPCFFFNLEHSLRIITMPQARKQIRSHLNDHVTRSQALANLAQHGTNMSTVPAGGLKDPQSFEEEEA
jgi:hypothetical protein